MNLLNKAVTLLIPFLFFSNFALADSLGKLDAESRRAVREAKMQALDAPPTGVEPSAPNNQEIKPGEPETSNANNFRSRGNSVQIENSGGTSAQKGRECVVQVGQVTESQTTHGTRQQNVVVVDGSVINVCQ